MEYSHSRRANKIQKPTHPEGIRGQLRRTKVVILTYLLEVKLVRKPQTGIDIRIIDVDLTFLKVLLRHPGISRTLYIGQTS